MTFDVVTNKSYFSSLLLFLDLIILMLPSADPDNKLKHICLCTEFCLKGFVKFWFFAAKTLQH